MAARRHASNEALRALVREAAWTNHNLAQAVNRVGREAGTALHYDRTTVSHWLSGSRPRPPVPAYVAEAFSRRLGRPVTVAETGFADRTGGDVAASPAGTTSDTALLHLVTADLDPVRQHVLRGLPYRVEWAVPAQRTGSGPLPRPSGRMRVGTGQLEAIHTMTAAFLDADRAFGGGHARSALATYLATDIATWLRAEASGKVRRELLSGAAALTYLLGFMSFDNLHHNLAQRYYRVAEQLAAEAGDTTVQAVVLRGMSAQAAFLGHHRRAAQLADCAVERAGTAAPHAVLAGLFGQAAVAHAALRHRATALSRLAEAEKYLERADDDLARIGNGNRADFAHQTGQVLTSFQDLVGAESALRDSLKTRPEAERRSRLLTTYQLAELQLRRGRAEHACEVWRKFLREYPHVNSARVRSALVALRAQLKSHRGAAALRDVLREANTA